MEEQYWRRCKENPDPAFVALDTTGQKLGANNMKPNGIDEPVHGWRIGIAVEAQARGQGIGHRLIQRAITFAMEKGVPYVNLFVDPTNTQAIALYQRIGFVEIGKISVLIYALELGSGYQRGSFVEGDEMDQMIDMLVNF